MAVINKQPHFILNIKLLNLIDKQHAARLQQQNCKEQYVAGFFQVLNFKGVKIINIQETDYILLSARCHLT